MDEARLLHDQSPRLLPSSVALQVQARLKLKTVLSVRPCENAAGTDRRAGKLKTSKANVVEALEPYLQCYKKLIVIFALLTYAFMFGSIENFKLATLKISRVVPRILAYDAEIPFYLSLIKSFTLDLERV